MTVRSCTETIGETAHFNTSDVLQSQYFTVVRCIYDHVFKLLGSLQTAFVTHDILERLIAAFAELSRGCLDVLFSQNCGDVRRHQSILGHNVGFQPDTHGVATTHDHGVSYSRYTLYLRNQVDFGVVVKERFVVAVIRAVKGKTEQHTGLTFTRDHTHFCYLGR